MVNKKTLIGGGILLLAVAGVSAVAALFIYKYKNGKKGIAVGDVVNLKFAATADDATICVKSGGSLIYAGVVRSIDTAAQTADVQWDTLVNPSSNVPCVVGTVSVWSMSTHTDDAAWVATYMGQPGKQAQLPALSSVPAHLPISALTKYDRS